MGQVGRGVSRAELGYASATERLRYGLCLAHIAVSSASVGDLEQR